MICMARMRFLLRGAMSSGTARGDEPPPGIPQSAPTNSARGRADGIVSWHERMTDAFFFPDGDGWIATSHTRGPWSAAHQHGGPPSALIAHVVEAAAPELSISRITVDFLR